MGVLAVYGVPDASTYIYYGLHNLQHRGQEGGGIATFDSHGDSHRYRGLGLLNEIFNNGQVGKLQGSLGIGCVKYANASRGGLDNVGPFFFRHHSGDFCVASDGNLVNSKQIAEYLEKRGTIFQTDTDAELLAHLIKKSASEDRIVNIRRLYIRGHDEEPHLCRPGQVRHQAPLHRQDRQWICRQQRILRIRHHGRGVHP